MPSSYRCSVALPTASTPTRTVHCSCTVSGISFYLVQGWSVSDPSVSSHGDASLYFSNLAGTHQTLPKKRRGCPCCVQAPSRRRIESRSIPWRHSFARVPDQPELLCLELFNTFRRLESLHARVCILYVSCVYRSLPQLFRRVKFSLYPYRFCSYSQALASYRQFPPPISVPSSICLSSSTQQHPV